MDQGRVCEGMIVLHVRCAGTESATYQVEIQFQVSGLNILLKGWLMFKGNNYSGVASGLSNHVAPSFVHSLVHYCSCA